MYSIFNKSKNDADSAAQMSPCDCVSAEQAHAAGKALEKKSAFSRAAEWYKREYQLAPSDEVLGAVAGIYLALHRYEELRVFLESCRPDEDGYYYRAACYELAYRTGASEEQQAELIESFLDIQCEETYMLRLAVLYVGMGREKEASRLCKKIKRLFLSGEAVDYAEKLQQHLSEGSAAAFVKEQPWLDDAVFRHISFSLCDPPLEDVSVQEQRSTPPAKKEETLSAHAAENKATRPEEKKVKISPLVEGCMKGIAGMGSLRTMLNTILNLLQTEKKRSDHEGVFRNNIRLIGAQGSGKTTAAYVVARFLCKAGVTSVEEPLIADANELAGASLEELHNNITELFNNAQGGCILIDNIDELSDTASCPHGLAVLDGLVRAYKAAQGEIPFIITGDEAQVNELLEKKRSFRELFDLPPIVLESYTVDELVQITCAIAEKKLLVFSDEAQQRLKATLEQLVQQPEFDGVHELERIVNGAYLNMTDRLSGKRRVSENARYLITEQDLEPADSAATLEELLQQLDGMTGLAGVKAQVRRKIDTMRFLELEKSFGVETPSARPTLHMVFSGNAGTGKTTVARLLGRIYRCLGVLSTGQLVECKRGDLVAEYVGGTAPLVRRKVKEALGGVLFIDEAYSLCKDDSDRYGNEAIEALLADIENYRDSFMVILAGYSEDMERFMDTNQGLRSRIPTRIEFEDYSVDELVEIFRKLVRENGKKLDVGLEKDIRRLIETECMKKDFGNARGVRNLVDSVLENMRSRVINSAAPAVQSDLVIVKREDLGVLPQEDSASTVADHLEELASLTGLRSVKEKVNAIVSAVGVQKMRREMGMESDGFGTLHMVFKGNAGTGKTTVARIIGKIYRELGVLKGGQLIECGRSDLVAAYQGQTALKTKAKIQEALDGVLFIDEAYALAGDDYGKEAIDTLVADIENYRDRLMVIIAGYSEDMDVFLAQNQGLASRFPNEIFFEDYTEEELMSIFRSSLSAKQRTMDSRLEPLVEELLRKKSAAADFGNARGVRNLVDRVIEKQSVRLFTLQSERALTKQDMESITEADIRGVI